VLGAVGDGVGVPFGIVAGQAWECEPEVDLSEYQRQKTGALFAAACVAGVRPRRGHAEPEPGACSATGWARPTRSPTTCATRSRRESLGKPVGRDAALGRPSAVASSAWTAPSPAAPAQRGAVAAIPACPGQAMLRALMLQEAQRLVPRKLATAA
jgi:geranylgeranyl diphosphate synthase, type II